MLNPHWTSRIIQITSLVCILLLGPQLAKTDENCGGYLDQPTNGWLFGTTDAWLSQSDKMELCNFGSAINGRVEREEWTREFGDNVWDLLVLRLGYCVGPRIREEASLYLNIIPGQASTVASKYCLDTWLHRDSKMDMKAIQDLTPWFRKETLCEFVTNAFPKPSSSDPVPLPDSNLHEFGTALCADVRAGTLGIDEAANQWAREIQKVNEEFHDPGSILTYMWKSLAWATSGFLQFVVALVAFIATIVGVAVGLKKLLE